MLTHSTKRLRFASLAVFITTVSLSAWADSQAPHHASNSPLLTELERAGVSSDHLRNIASGETEEADLSGPVRRETLAHVAIARSPALVAGARRIRAITARAKAETSLPEPELMADIWQVPISRPWAIGDAQMIMLSISQSFPAPGVRGLRERAALTEARAEAQTVVAKARALIRSLDAAFVDYVEATLRHEAMLHYRESVSQMLELAQARLDAGGSLADIARAEVELARADIDIAKEEQQIEKARIKLNGLLAREPSAPIGPPVIDEPSTVRISMEDLVARSKQARPELAALESRREAEILSAEASRKEANLPSFGVGLSYFPPSGMVRDHGIGASFSMSLPWLSGAKKNEAKAFEERAAAEASELDDERIRLGSDAALFATNAKEAEQQYRLLIEKALPMGLRSREAAEAGYAAGQSDAFAWLMAAREVAKTKLDIANARASLERALAELDFIAGVKLPREPLIAFEGADDAR